MSNQFWFNQSTAATNNTTALWYPLATYVPQALPSVVAKQSEYALDRDMKLGPVEWLKRQVDDVCVLAALA